MAIGNRSNSNLRYFNESDSDDSNNDSNGIYTNINNIENGYSDNSDQEDYEFEDVSDQITIEYEYDPEETSSSKYNLVLCCPSLFQSKEKYLVFTRFKKYNQEYINNQVKYHFQFYKNVNDKYDRNEFLSQWKIPQIAQVIYTENNEASCVLKTFWLKVFQRQCKKYLLQKNS